MAEYPTPKERREVRDSRLARRAALDELTVLGQEIEAESGPGPHLCPSGCGRWMPCRHCPEASTEEPRGYPVSGLVGMFSSGSPDGSVRAKARNRVKEERVAEQTVRTAIAMTHHLPPHLAHAVRAFWAAWEMDGRPRDAFTEGLAAEVLALTEEAA